MYKYTLILFLILTNSIGCATTTKPNISIVYNIPAISKHLPQLSNLKSQATSELPMKIQHLFLQLYEKYPTIAIEIGKLPEFQEDIGVPQELSLQRFIDLLVKASPEEKANLNEFLNVGKPEFRRYCSPLQAIIWLLEKDDYDPSESPLKYPLDTLLTKSWNLNILSRGEEKYRWDNFDIVTDRLNAPYLIDFYEKRKFLYEFRMSPDGSAYTLFMTKTGHCVDVTVFTVYCLRKGGYTASEHKVAPIPGYGSFHAVTLFEMNGNKFIMDNGRPWPRGIVPYYKYKTD